MSLETLVNGYNAVDQAVLKQYTRLGQHIPEEKLYTVTTGLSYVGIGTFCVLDSLLGVGMVKTVYIPPLLNFTAIITYSVAIAGDFWANVYGLNGELPSQQQTDSTKAINPVAEEVMKWSRIPRLPFFAIGATFLGMLGYDVVNDLILDQPVEVVDYIWEGLGTISFLSSASSMYLKDQDPKLLQKKPSKVKAFFQRVYERAKEKISPAPVPVPVAGYSVLEENVGTQ